MGKECFSYSGVEEIILPSALKEIDEKSFGDCDNLKIVWVEDGFALAPSAFLSSHTAILDRKTRVGE